MRSVEETANLGQFKWNWCFSADGWSPGSTGYIWSQCGSCPLAEEPSFIMSSTLRPSQPITIFALWPFTCQYHHTTTHPEALCAATEWPQWPVVAATASGQPGAPKWSYDQGAQRLPQGCRAWDWPSHPFLDSLWASETGPGLRPSWARCTEEEGGCT